MHLQFPISQPFEDDLHDRPLSPYTVDSTGKLPTSAPGPHEHSEQRLHFSQLPQSAQLAHTVVLSPPML